MTNHLLSKKAYLESKLAYLESKLAYATEKGNEEKATYTRQRIEFTKSSLLGLAAKSN